MLNEIMIIAALIGNSYQPVHTFKVEHCLDAINHPAIVSSYKEIYGPDTIFYCNSEPKKKEVLQARITGYYADPNKKSALGSNIRPGGTAAVSRNCSHLLGKKVYIDQHGLYDVNDLTAEWIGNKFDGCTVDLARATEEEASKVGNATKQVTIIK